MIRKGLMNEESKKKDLMLKTFTILKLMDIITMTRISEKLKDTLLASLKGINIIILTDHQKKVLHLIVKKMRKKKNHLFTFQELLHLVLL